METLTSSRGLLCAGGQIANSEGETALSPKVRKGVKKKWRGREHDILQQSVSHMKWRRGERSG